MKPTQLRLARLLAAPLLSLAVTAPVSATEAAPVHQAIPLRPPAVDLKQSADAVNWQPMVLSTVDDLLPPPPPAPDTEDNAKEIAELVYLQAHRSADDRKAIAYWNAEPSPLRWGEEARDQIITASLPPTYGSRTLAMMHVAVCDAVLAAWKAKAKYRRPAPSSALAGLKPLDALAGDNRLPSYPSEDAAVAGAASTVLAALFPDQAAAIKQKAKLEGEARIVAGANFRSDVDAGFKLGQAIGERVLAYARTDGSDRQAKLPLAYKPGQWHTEHPMTPLAGQWRTWLLKSGSQFTANPPIPADNDNPRFRAARDEVFSVHEHLTQHQIERAVYWNFDVPSILWEDITRRAVVTGRKPSAPDPMNIRWTDIGLEAARAHNLDTIHTARVLGVLHMTMADSFITTWATKYRVLEPRPYMMAPAGHPFSPLVNTPVHPSFPSAHASGSMAAAEVLGRYFPDQKAYFVSQAKEAAMSRLWGGIHYRMDNDCGLELGQHLGDYCVEQADAHGWYR